jgi:hypothetical protein
VVEAARPQQLHPPGTLCASVVLHSAVAGRESHGRLPFRAIIPPARKGPQEPWTPTAELRDEKRGVRPRLSMHKHRGGGAGSARPSSAHCRIGTAAAREARAFRSAQKKSPAACAGLSPQWPRLHSRPSPTTPLAGAEAPRPRFPKLAGSCCLHSPTCFEKCPSDGADHQARWRDPQPPLVPPAGREREGVGVRAGKPRCSGA